MVALNSKEINNNYSIENKAISSIETEDIRRDICVISIEVKKPDQKPKTIINEESNVIILHPTHGTHWVVVIKKENTMIYCSDSFGLEHHHFFTTKY